MDWLKLYSGLHYYLAVAEVAVAADGVVEIAVGVSVVLAEEAVVAVVPAAVGNSKNIL